MADGKLRVIGLERADEWDATVRSFSHHDAYWLAAYARAFERHGDGEPLLVSYDGPDGTRGVNVVMRRDVADAPRLAGRVGCGELFDLATPYGYGGWLVEGDDHGGLFQAYERWCARTGVVCEFVRFHLMVANHRACAGFYDVAPLGEVVYVDTSSAEGLWANLSSTCRNRIRRAQRLGVRVRSGRAAGAYRLFRGLYEGTMDRVGARPYYYFGDDCYESLRRGLPHEALVFWAEADGAAVAAAIMLVCNGMMGYHLGGSVHVYAGGAAMNLLMYEAALWGCEHGYRTLHLGGALAPEATACCGSSRPLARADEGGSAWEGACFWRSRSGGSAPLPTARAARARVGTSLRIACQRTGDGHSARLQTTRAVSSERPSRRNSERTE